MEPLEGAYHCIAEMGRAIIWRAENDAGRAEVVRIYRLLGAEEKYQSTWFEGLHSAGFTFNNIAKWLKEKFAIENNR